MTCKPNIEPQIVFSIAKVAQGEFLDGGGDPVHEDLFIWDCITALEDLLEELNVEESYIITASTEVITNEPR